MIAAAGPGRAGLRHRPRGPRHRTDEQVPRLRRPGGRRRHGRRQPSARPAGRCPRLRRCRGGADDARVRSIRLLTNNPGQGEAVSGITGSRSTRWSGLRTVAHRRNADLPDNEVGADGPRPSERRGAGCDDCRRHRPGCAHRRRSGAEAPRPGVVVKLAQSLDGRIATACGDSKWISGEPERRVSHALRAACDAVMVGVGTVVQRRSSAHGSGRFPAHRRPASSSTARLRAPLDARLFTDDGSTLVLTTPASDPRLADQPPSRRRRRRGGPGARRSCRPARRPRASAGARHGGGAGRGRRHVGDVAALGEGWWIGSSWPSHRCSSVLASTPSATSGIQQVADAISLTNRTVATVGDDVIIAGDVTPPARR